MPGEYNVEVPVGFYTQVMGLGKQPDDVVFTSPKGVYCEEGSLTQETGALDTFWRSAENFKTTATFPWATTPSGGMLWAVSQASPLRRVHVTTNLALYEYVPPYLAAGYASGGFMGDSQVDGAVFAGSQQQFCTRNTNIGNGGWQNGNWNMVFIGSPGAPAPNCGSPVGVVTVDETPLVAEKPFITFDPSAQKYSLEVPAPRERSKGPSFADPSASTVSVDFEHVYVASNDTDTARSINAKLSNGLHVVLAPGIFALDAPLELTHEGQVLLGLGLATLVSADGNAVVTVSTAAMGARVAGLILQAGVHPTEALLVWGVDPPSQRRVGTGQRRPLAAERRGGREGSIAAAPADPAPAFAGGMSDLFVRVGGPDGDVPVQAKLMVDVRSSDVFGDNLWLWRADHTSTGIVANRANPCETGLRVSGDRVRMYGLAVEHTLADQLQWSGEDGEVYFFQCELPYDVDQASFGDAGYVGYRVADGVSGHSSHGAGVYTFMRDNQVTMKSGIVAPAALESSFVSPLAVFLSGQGTLEHVINDKGPGVDPSGGGGHAEWWCPAQTEPVSPLEIF
mmetsp:Transcript_7289/g.24215  ORF Transcript_7289/g.24215 Transcript_7289/m.24215 type:complete len:566 (+) Transcript_7289:374-2071(+)